MYLVKTDFSAMPYKVRMHMQIQARQAFPSIYDCLQVGNFLKLSYQYAPLPLETPLAAYMYTTGKLENEAPKLGMMMTGNFDAILTVDETTGVMTAAIGNMASEMMNQPCTLICDQSTKACDTWDTTV